jgi:hypothetical protein
MVVPFVPMAGMVVVVIRAAGCHAVVRSSRRQALLMLPGLVHRRFSPVLVTLWGYRVRLDVYLGGV